MADKKMNYHTKGCFYAAEEAMKNRISNYNSIIPSPCGEQILIGNVEEEINENLKDRDTYNFRKTLEKVKSNYNKLNSLESMN